MLWSRRFAFVLLSWLTASCNMPATPLGDKPHGLDHLEGAPVGENLDSVLRRATLESEAFRLSLLEVTDTGSTRAQELAFAIVRFRTASSGALAGRRTTGNFTQAVGELAGWMAGTQGRLSGDEVYGPFSGRWYGLWDTMEVDHHWGPFIEFDPPREYLSGNDRIWLKGYQYAWVGDGYGVNLLCTKRMGKVGGDFLLGYVIHVQNGNLEVETARRPHVGIPADPGQLIWLTSGGVYLEECFETAAGEEAYAITGFDYTRDRGALKATRAFQAIYSRTPTGRIPWFRFNAEL